MPASAALTGSSQVQDSVSRPRVDFCPRVARENAEKTHTSSHNHPAAAIAPREQKFTFVLRAGRSGKQDEWKTSENNPYLPYGRYSSVQRLLYDGCYSGYISPQSGVLSYSMCAAMFQGVVGVLDVKGLT